MNSSDFPAIFVAADRASLDAQHRYLVTSRLRLSALVVAAAGGAFTWNVEGFLNIENLDLLGALAAFALLVGVSAEAFIAIASPQRTWYEGRAIAESAKTLTWRYMTRAAPFDVAGSASEREADRLLVDRLKSLYQDVSSLTIPPDVATPSQISELMRSNRSLDISQRQQLYLDRRIEDQRRWYAEKSRSNHRSARIATVFLILLELLGLTLAVVKAFGGASVDLIGVVAALAGAAVAWTQAKRYSELAGAYSVAAQELAAAAALLRPDMSESEWSQYVDDTEEAISREHTLWRASRGVR